MKDTTAAFLAGMIVASVAIVVLNMIPQSYIAQAKRALAECEAELPRNQTCEIKAAPTAQEIE